MNFKDACLTALQHKPGYRIISASELENGWLFSFGLEDGSVPDESPMFISKIDGSIQAFSFEEHIFEILNSEPISITQINLNEV